VKKETTPEPSFSGLSDSLEHYVKEMLDDSERWFPGRGLDLSVLVLGLAGEAGEVADQLKKHLRGSKDWDATFDKLQVEIIDVFHYWCMIVGVLGIDVDKVYRMKRAYNIGRYES
jgi:NTP pyrophosphatase (non-canonical NTP hydrolase)